MHSLSEKEKQDIVKKFIKHATIQNYLPPYVRCGKEGESNLVVLKAMKSVYAHITTTRHIQDLTLKNVLFFVVVSTNVHTNQMHFAKTIRAFQYSI
jgi:hypothetical protein